ncbi:unnamed protein product, partial [Amoebophrya sp. A25]
VEKVLRRGLPDRAAAAASSSSVVISQSQGLEELSRVSDALNLIKLGSEASKLETKRSSERDQEDEPEGGPSDVLVTPHSASASSSSGPLQAAYDPDPMPALEQLPTGGASASNPMPAAQNIPDHPEDLLPPSQATSNGDTWSPSSASTSKEAVTLTYPVCPLQDGRISEERLEQGMLTHKDWAVEAAQKTFPDEVSETLALQRLRESEQPKNCLETLRDAIVKHYLVDIEHASGLLKETKATVLNKRLPRRDIPFLLNDLRFGRVSKTWRLQMKKRNLVLDTYKADPIATATRLRLLETTSTKRGEPNLVDLSVKKLIREDEVPAKNPNDDVRVWIRNAEQTKEFVETHLDKLHIKLEKKKKKFNDEEGIKKYEQLISDALRMKFEEKRPPRMFAKITLALLRSAEAKVQRTIEEDPPGMGHTEDTDSPTRDVAMIQRMLRRFYERNLS